MKKILKLIIILIIVLLITVIAITILVAKRELNGPDNLIKIEETSELPENDIKIHIENDRNRFYVVKNCVEQFYQYYQYINSDNIDVKISDEEIDIESIKKWYKEKVYALLDKEYINYRSITLDNVDEKLENIGKVKVIVDKVYTKYLENGSYICFVKGRIKAENSEIEQVKMAVRLSPTNTFKIFLEDYLIENGYDDFEKDIETTQLCKFEIVNEKYNTYKSKAIGTEDYIKDLFAHYKSSIINDQEFSYKLINKDYKKIRFQNKEKFIEYVGSNYSKIVSTTLDSYKQIISNGINDYLCKDNYGNYYIFKEVAPFQYTVMLDNYTIPTDEFTKEYNTSSEAEKVILNIKKFFKGIDDENYGYSYSVLSESFRNNTFSTETDFINYAKQNFFEENEIEYVSCEKESGVYIYKIKVSDLTGKTSEVREFNMIVKLDSGTNFQMSFGINN